MKKIYVSDITLSELSQNREVSLLFREKTAIATCVDGLGADAVELAPIKNAREDNIIYRTISANVKNGVVAIPVGFSAESVAQAWECVKDAAKPRLQVVVPTSTVQMEYIYHMKAEKMLVKIEELTAEAKKLCDDVEFVAIDATRADADFLINACAVAEKNGAGIVTLCDDAGIFMPEEMAELVKKIKASCNALVFVKASDSISMAVAVSIAAVCAGADGVKAALAGENIMLAGKFSDAISARDEDPGISVALNNTQVHTGVDSLLKKMNHDVYASESAEDSGKDSIFLDADSTIAQVSEAAKLLGYDLSDEDNGKVHKAVLQVCAKKDSVGAKELEALIASEAMQAPSTYHLESYTTSCGNLINAMSQVVLKRGDETVCGVSMGDGAIDSVFLAIEQSIGYHYELDDFQIQAVTEGKEALGSAVVRLRNNGKLYSGNGISSDIVGASIRAYINALNKIVFEEE